MGKPIFIHIPKTAGSTLRTLITENYQSQQVLSLYGDPKEILVAAAENRGKIDQYQLIQGHTPYGTHRFLGIKNPRYFTFLRDPITRFLSDVAHTVRHDYHGFHHVLAVPELSESERISKALDIAYYRNNMTQYVSGAFTTETISMMHLGVAIDNLWNSEFVGITEHFDISLLIMAKKLGWRHIIPEKRNVRPDKDDPITPELKARLDRALAYDCMLYTVAQDHLEQARRHYGLLLDEAASQLTEIMQAQESEHPDTQFATYMVGQTTEASLGQYQSRLEKGSPLYRWLNE